MFKFDMDTHSIDEVKEIAEMMSESVLLRFVNMREQLNLNIKHIFQIFNMFAYLAALERV